MCGCCRICPGFDLHSEPSRDGIRVKGFKPCMEENGAQKIEGLINDAFNLTYGRCISFMNLLKDQVMKLAHQLISAARV